MKTEKNIVISNVGGVMVEFDSDARRQNWLDDAYSAIALSTIKGGSITQAWPGIDERASARQFGIRDDLDKVFEDYLKDLAARAGQGYEPPVGPDERDAMIEVMLNDMLVNKVATLFFEHSQANQISSGRLTAEKAPFIDEVIAASDDFTVYTTGSEDMPRQFLKAVGLSEQLGGKVYTTFPGHTGKLKSPRQIVDVLEDKNDQHGYTRCFLVDHNPAEMGRWLEAADTARKENLCDPVAVLYKPDLAIEQTGITETSKGNILVVRSNEQLARYVRSNREPRKAERPCEVSFEDAYRKFESVK